MTDAHHTNEDADSDAPRVVSLAIEPSRLDAAAKSCTLMLKAEELTEGNAASYCSKAVKALRALPDDFDMYSVWDWRDTPLRELPQDQAQAVLERAKTSLDLLREGSQCRNCIWRQTSERTVRRDLGVYRRLAYLLCVKARLEIARGQYERSFETIRVGLTAARHIGATPTFERGLMGFMIADFLLGQVEDLAQAEGAPNLYAAIHALSRPLIDMEASTSSEATEAHRMSMPEDWCEVKCLIMRRLDAHAAALECIEALRHFAAGHDGRLPTQLSEIADIQIPNDSVTGKPVAYRIEGSKAILEVSAPKLVAPRDSLRYEIAVTR